MASFPPPSEVSHVNEAKPDTGVKIKYPFNVNYARWFNSQAVEFLTGTGINADSELRDGFVTVSGSTQVFERPKDGGKSFPEFRRENNELVVGSYWTAREKEKFFYYLARKSRHDLAAVAEAIGTKSVVEVQEYHDVLCAAAEASENEPSGLSMEDIPAAREMSETWIAVENFQSSVIRGWEDEKEAHRVKMYQRRKEGEKKDEINQNERIGLLNSSELFNLATRVFSNARLDSETELDWPMIADLSQELVDELEEHIQDCVRALVKKSILEFLNRSKHRAADDGNSAVSEEDAREAIKLLKFPKHSRLYWMDVCGRLNIGLRMDDRSIPSEDHVKNYLSPVWGRKSKLRKIDPKLLPYYNLEAEGRNQKKKRKLSEMTNGELSEEDDYGSDDSFNSVVYSDNEIAGMTNSHGTNEYGYSTDEDYIDSADEEAQAMREEQDLTAQEEKYLDMLDSKASREEEHLLLKWMTTFQQIEDEEGPEQDNDGIDMSYDNEPDLPSVYQPSLRLKKWLKTFPQSGFSVFN
ncbi:hypothetical protein TRVA0_021S01618 [Trichomonascus vanleenenianus]|uniref:uncharacterized protein n=1 Tax=Trichomonascus vanleenenianus TaxID=2268995 RepID=UPI003EC9E7DD